jgi:hypothetical protein
MKNWIENFKRQLKQLEDSIPDEALNSGEFGYSDIRSNLLYLEQSVDMLEKFDSIVTNPFVVPKGYKWCSDCKALTPHYKDYSHYTSCKVCGNSNYGNGCHNCGWEEPEEDMQLEVEVTVHGHGCHCDHDWMFDPDDEDSHRSIYTHAEKVLNDFLSQYRDLGYMRPDPKKAAIKKILEDKNMLKCSCPRMIVYPVTNIYNFHGGYYASMDCMNAYEWSYDVRCPVCGDVFEVSDTNC